MGEKRFSVLFEDDEPMEFNATKPADTYKPEVAASVEHFSKLKQKREAKEKTAKEDSSNEKREVVMDGAQLKCQYAQGPGTLVVTSNEINLQDQLWATKGDGNNMVNLQFKGACGHPKWAGKPPPPCMSVIKLSPWQNLGTGIVQEQTVLVKESFITCDPTPNVAVMKPIPQVESIKSGMNEKENKIKREIYLTFDDGIQAGTEEVLILLKQKGIKATFFLTGIHLWYFIEKALDRKKALSLLKDIYENHSIGNHSFSHANDYYENYYSKGGVKSNGNGAHPEDKRSVFRDFIKCKEQIIMYLDEICGKGVITNRNLPLAKNQTIALARFPGRNTWYTNKIKNCKSDTQDEAKELYDNRGYQIYGWDCEWHMQFNFHDDSVTKVKSKVDNKTIDFSKDEDAHPYFDMYSKANIGKDRLIDGWQSVRDDLLDKVYDGGLFDSHGEAQEKAVLLMHERAFRNGKLINDSVDMNNTESISKLSNLIDYFIKIKAEFKTLDNY